MKQIFSADPLSENLDPTGNWFRYLRVEYKATDIFVFKVLLSKLLFTEEKFTEEDEVILFESREKILLKMAADKGFKEKHLWLVFLTRNIFMNLSAFCYDKESILILRNELASLFNHGRSLLNASIYYGSKVETICRMQSAQPRKPKARNRIGVGYRDKGNAKNTAFDGSPSWQEVATDEWFQSHHIAESRSSKLEQLYKDLMVGEVYCWQRTKAPKNSSSFVRGMKG